MTTSKVRWDHTKAVLLALRENIKCPICDKLPEDPHMLWCKHSFCKECILKFSQCPECNYPVKSRDLARNIMLSHLLNAMKASSEIIYSCPDNEDLDVTEQRFDKKLSITNETKILKTKENKQEPLVKRLSATKSKTESKKKEYFSRPENNEKIEKQNQLQKIVMKTPNKNTNNDQNIEEQGIKRKARDRKNSLSSGKDSIHDSVKTPKNSNITSVTSKKHGDKTPKPKSKTSPNNCNPKSCILFSAKKVHPSNKVNVKGETPLQIACRLGKLDMVQKLLDEGAEPNVKDYANWTPLCDAVGSGNVEVVRALLEAGAGVNVPSNQNTTALVESVVRRDTAMVKLLMNYGADMHLRTALNNTALSIADEEIKNVLMSVGDISIQPFPRVRQQTRAILAVKLIPDHISQLMTLCQKFNLTLSTTFMEDISHVVVEKTENNLCHGSFPVMMGILSGATVVGTDWVTACLEENKLLSADGFEPTGTEDTDHTDVFVRARLNKENLLPRLFDGCHISLQHDQPWPENHKHDIVALIQASGAVYQPRQCDPERILPSEQTVMFHAPTNSPLTLVSHIILYQPGPSEPLLKYNMAHVKTLSVSWFVQCIKTFSLSM